MARTWWRRSGLAAMAVLALSAPVAAASTGSATAHRGASAPSPTSTYVAMPDGVRLAVAVAYPAGFSAHRRWPVVFEMDGYEGGGEPVDPGYWGNRYVTVHASVRGSGCSGGRFDLFDSQTAEDGRFLIDEWAARQPWADGRVAIVGHSYPGLTGMAIAERNPRHLAAVAVSGLVDDLYRGLAYPGGVPNGGFPVAWPLILRPEQELGGSLGRYASDQPNCARSLGTRAAPNPLDDPAVNGATGREDGEWWRAHSLITHLDGLRRPVHIISTYQDEQTGPRGGVELWRHVRAGVPKRLVLTNGVHATHEVAHADELAWLDCWVLRRGRACPGGIADPRRRVQVRFDTTGPGNNPFVDHVHPAVALPDFPAPTTAWQRLYLRSDGSLGGTAPARSEPGRTFVATSAGRGSYLSGAGVADSTGDLAETLVDAAYRQGYGAATDAAGPDALVWRLPVHSMRTLAGPLVADLWLTSSAPDTDVFVTVADRAPDGSLSVLQRGLLRASFRATDSTRSDRITAGPHRGEILVPFHPFVSPQLLTPLAPALLRVEVFPVGHVFRAGHELIVGVSAPPVMDELNTYAGAQPAALDTVLSSPGHASSLLVPWLPGLPGRAPVAAAAPACGTLTGVRCARPLA